MPQTPPAAHIRGINAETGQIRYLAPMKHYLVINTCPDLATAQRLAEIVVGGKFAACVNVVPGVQSIYAWNGALQHDQECLLYIKTRADRYAALEEALRRHHPYELPEIIAVPIESGLPAYLAWVDQQTEE